VLAGFETHPPVDMEDLEARLLPHCDSPESLSQQKYAILLVHSSQPPQSSSFSLKDE
jgi:hypothetical protein